MVGDETGQPVKHSQQSDPSVSQLARAHDTQHTKPSQPEPRPAALTSTMSLMNPACRAQGDTGTTLLLLS